MACTNIPCGVAVDLANAIRDIIVEDEAGCAGAEATVETSIDCEDLTDLVSCAQVVTLKEAFLSALTADGCGRYSIHIFDFTTR